MNMRKNAWLTPLGRERIVRQVESGVVALFNQYIAAGFPEQHGALNTNPLSQVATNEEQFLAHPHHS